MTGRPGAAGAPASRAHGTPVVVAVTLLAGVALGSVDFLGQKVLPYPWANLANSAAVWAVLAFVLGTWVRGGVRASAACGVALLVVAVESYEVTAASTQGDSWANVVAPTTLLWIAFGIVAGVVFGAAGGWWRTDRGWARVLGTVFPVAVLLAEAAVLGVRAGDGARHTASWNHDSQTAVIEIGIALFVLVSAARGARRAVASLLLSLPLAALGGLAFTVGTGAFGA